MVWFATQVAPWIIRIGLAWILFVIFLWAFSVYLQRRSTRPKVVRRGSRK